MKVLLMGHLFIMALFYTIFYTLTDNISYNITCYSPLRGHVIAGPSSALWQLAPAFLMIRAFVWSCSCRAFVTIIMLYNKGSPWYNVNSYWSCPVCLFEKLSLNLVLVASNAQLKARLRDSCHGPLSSCVLAC